MSQRQPPPVQGWSQPGPHPSKAKKPIWRRWWFIAIVAVLLISGPGQAFGAGDHECSASYLDACIHAIGCEQFSQCLTQPVGIDEA